MGKYDYRRAITEAVKDWIVNESDILENEYNEERDDELSNWIYDEVWTEDSITGNGIYYYDTEDKCSEYLSENFDLLYEAAQTFCNDDDINILMDHYKNKDLARYFDCTIGCYLLDKCIEKALEELKYDGKAANK